MAKFHETRTQLKDGQVFGDFIEKNQQEDPHFEDLRSHHLPHEPGLLEQDVDPSTYNEITHTEGRSNQTNHGTADDDFQGVELKEYAKREGISVDALWRKIRTGSLIARTENGFVYVYGLNQPDATKMKDAIGGQERLNDMISQHGLPPLPVAYEDSDFDRNLPVVPHHNQAVADVALLLDHLTVAKEESKQVLRLSQESITRITQMSEEIVKVKDELIAQQERNLKAKEESITSYEREIAILKQQLADKEESNRRLRQEVEDLEMLTRTLGGEV